MIPDHLDDGFTYAAESMLYRKVPRMCKADVAHRLQQDRKEGLLWLVAPPRVWGVPRERVEAYATDPGGDPPLTNVLQLVVGQSAAEEDLDWSGLFRSVQLQITNPSLSELSCSVCRRYAVDHDTGEVYVSPEGVYVDLPEGTAVPCETRQGCGKGHWSAPVGLSVDRYARTWRHWWRYRRDPGELGSCPVFSRNSLTIDWLVSHGGDRRFNPFAPGHAGG